MLNKIKLVYAMVLAMIFGVMVQAQQTVQPIVDYGEVVDGTSFQSMGTSLVALLAVAVAAGLGYLILRKQADNVWRLIRRFF